MTISYLSKEDWGEKWAIDLEGDLIPSTKVYCAYAINIGTGEKHELIGPEQIRSFVEDKRKLGHKFIAHNMLGYDADALNRLCGCHLKIDDVIDTMLMSMLYSPSLEGGHSARAWGQRLQYEKLEYSDFSAFKPEMLPYCERDTELCRRIYKVLVSRMLAVGFTEDSLSIEHQSWSLIQKQKKNGFAFNIQEARPLFAKLNQIKANLQEEIYTFWPPELKLVKHYKKAFKNDGTETKDYTAHKETFPKIVQEDDGSYSAYNYVEFNIGSPQQRVTKLLELGWECLPDERTKAGTPSPTSKGQLVPSLVEFVESSGKQEVRLLARWLEISARASMIGTWIDAYNARTGCIHGSLWLANTLRYRHSDPNTANIPGVRVTKEGSPLLGEAGSWTYEARDLWTTRDSINRVLVGVDAKGIQLRVLAHYLNNKKFTEAVLDGDPHSYNQTVGGFRTRSIAKTFIYAFLLGAGDAKIGQIIAGSPRDGREIKGRFIANFPGLDRLLNDLARQVDRTGRIILCDGTPVIVSKPHTRLGYLLQGDENRIMKRAAILTNTQVKHRRLDVLKVGDIHDEWQNDVLEAHSEEFAFGICPSTFKQSGESFNYNIPISCDAKIGRTWASTH